MDPAAQSEASVSQLLGSLATETGSLVRQELQLATTEVGEKAKNAAADVAIVAAAGALFHAGLLALVFAVVVGLGTLVPMWISALIIGVVGMGSGYALVRRGLESLRGLDLVPQQALNAVRQDKVWMKEQVR